MEFEWNNPCAFCGKEHTARVEKVLSGKGVLSALPELLREKGVSKPFLLSDENTHKAAGEKVADLLSKENFTFTQWILKGEHIEPNEQAMGSVLLHYDASCDGVVAIGSGVIGDLAKILANSTRLPLFTVATAPSMDGFASETSSMVRDGLKVSIPSRCPCVIIGDTDILKRAPMRMLRAGLGDMLAKYISICEWRIGSLVTGEYYCEEIAELVRRALKKCIDNADGLLKREDGAVEAVFEGLVLGGLAMAYAGVSRPASGVEHYISHVWEMAALSRGETADLHGLQCAVGTRIAAKLYARLLSVKPDRELALRHAKQFDYERKARQMRTFLGNGAETMIALEKKEGKYRTVPHLERLEIILSHWDEIRSIIREEIPSPETVDALFRKIDMPALPSQVGASDSDTPAAFLFTGDIRDKYVLSRLLWDLGLEEEFAQTIMEDMK